MPICLFIYVEILNAQKFIFVRTFIIPKTKKKLYCFLFFYFKFSIMTSHSILMSTTSTLLSLVMMPICLLIYGSSWMTYAEMTSFIPFGGIFLTLFLTLFPVVVGVIVRRHSEKIANMIMKVFFLKFFI